MRLVATSGDQMLSFPLRQGSTLIGRHPSCHVCIPANGLSRRHCQCFIDGNRAIVRDLGSSNGTFVNSRRIDRTELQDGDLITLGGFQLRFDAEGAMPRAAGFAQGAEATERVVVAETTDAPPHGPAEAFVDAAAPHMDAYLDGEPHVAGEGVAPPDDFPESPDGEETPVDNAFVPAPYTGAQTFGLAEQPQLVVRDGRWFLRDPRTGREVEIAPRDGSAAVAPAAEGRRPNVKLLLTVVGAAVAVVLAFAFFILTPPPAKPNGDRRISTAAFHKIENEGVALIRQANKEAEFKKRQPLLTEALAKFDLASSKRPDIGSASLFGQYVRLRLEAKGDMAKFNWSEALRYLESVTNVFSASREASAFAEEEKRTVRYEQHALGIGYEAYGRVAEDDSDESIREALKKLAALPKDTYAWRHFQPIIAKLRRSLFDRRMASAKQAMNSQKWPEAVRFLEEAKPFTDDPAPLNKQITHCQKCETEQEQLAQGKQEYDGKNYDVARGIFQAIPKDSPYYDEAQNYVTRIDQGAASRARQALVKQIEDLYREGAGDKATKMIADSKVQELAYIPERVTRITELLATGKAAEKEDRYRDAQLAYQQAVDAEPDAENAYHKRAAALLADLKGRYTEIAAMFAKRGHAELRKTDGDPVKARKDFDEALHWDPEQALAKSGLRTLDRQAAFLYNDGDRYERENRPEKAKESFERALAYSKPGSDLHGRTKQRLEKYK